MKQMLIPVYLFTICFSIISCQTAPSPEERLEELALAFHKLDCRQALLETETRSSWDGVVEQLDARLPEDMPAAEKNNMLRVRNAGLIRMFETYQGLPDSVQALVSRAEKKDNEIVAALNAIKVERSALDKEKRSLFLAIEDQAADRLPSLRDRFNALRNTPCQ